MKSNADIAETVASAFTTDIIKILKVQLCIILKDIALHLSSFHEVSKQGRFKVTLHHIYKVIYTEGSWLNCVQCHNIVRLPGKVINIQCHSEFTNYIWSHFIPLNDPYGAAKLLKAANLCLLS